MRERTQLLDEIIEAQRLRDQIDIPFFAGSSNLNPGGSEEGIQPSTVEAVPPNNDGFHTCRQSGDTLDAFAPLTHRGMKP